MSKRVLIVLALAAAGIVLVAQPWTSRDKVPPAPAEVVTVKETAVPSEQAASRPESFRQAARKAMPSVVNVYSLKEVVRRTPYFGWPLFGNQGDGGGSQTSLGSGVVVSSDGYVLTNNHVVDGADAIAVAFRSGETTQARVVGVDPETDLAVLKIAASGLTPITFADPRSVEIGDPALAIGNPFGVGQTVTRGIVSATGRNRLGINTFENFIQTDAAINPGNSGGALVDGSGNLIGINTAIFSESGGSQGIGFAIPVSIARQVVEQIIKTGKVERGWLGVATQDSAQGTAGKGGPGVAIVRILPRGPADAGGIKPGDAVLAIDAKPVADSVELVNRIAAIKPGDTTQVTVTRNGREERLTVRVGKRPSPQQQQ
ncbi:MAG TPA: trypsin-like peptidase domain-containing protein [Casimicrobiaceae bacterium]